jgi:hypothetical protein
MFFQHLVTMLLWLYYVKVEPLALLLKKICATQLKGRGLQSTTRHGQPGPDNPARTDPKIPGRTGLGLHFVSGSGLTFKPERLAGPGSGLQFSHFSVGSGQTFACLRLVWA